MVKNLPVMQCGRPGFDPWVRKIPWKRKWKPNPVFLPGEYHGQRSLPGYKELDRTEVTEHAHTQSVYILNYLCVMINCCFCSSVSQLCLSLCDPMDCSMPGLPVPHHLSEFAQVYVYCISDTILPSHPLMTSSPSILNLSQHQGLFQ